MELTFDPHILKRYGNLISVPHNYGLSIPTSIYATCLTSSKYEQNHTISYDFIITAVTITSPLVKRHKLLYKETRSNLQLHLYGNCRFLKAKDYKVA